MFVNGGFCNYLAPLCLLSTRCSSEPFDFKEPMSCFTQTCRTTEHLRLGIFVVLLKLYSCLEILPSFKILYRAVMERERKFDRHRIWLVKVSSVPLVIFLQVMLTL